MGEIKHGHCQGLHVSKEYDAWRNMKARCYRPTSWRYKNYGARGISVCGEWINSFPRFIEDMGEAPTSKHSIGRIDNDGNYCKDNCRWETQEQQTANKSTLTLFTHNGQTLSLRRWCETLHINYKMVWRRINDAGKTFEDAISAPKRTWPSKQKQ